MLWPLKELVNLRLVAIHVVKIATPFLECFNQQLERAQISLVSFSLISHSNSIILAVYVYMPAWTLNSYVVFCSEMKMLSSREWLLL